MSAIRPTPSKGEARRGDERKADPPPGWAWEPRVLRAKLEALGYDVTVAEVAVDPPATTTGGSLTARRQRGVRAHLIVVDDPGRLRAEVTAILEESGQDATLGGANVRLVNETRWVATITGALASIEQLTAIVGALDDLASPVATAHPPPGPRAEPEPPPTRQADQVRAAHPDGTT